MGIVRAYSRKLFPDDLESRGNSKMGSRSSVEVEILPNRDPPEEGSISSYGPEVMATEALPQFPDLLHRFTSSLEKLNLNLEILNKQVESLSKQGEETAKILNQHDRDILLYGERQQNQIEGARQLQERLITLLENQQRYRQEELALINQSLSLISRLEVRMVAVESSVVEIPDMINRMLIIEKSEKEHQAQQIRNDTIFGIGKWALGASAAALGFLLKVLYDNLSVFLRK